MTAEPIAKLCAPISEDAPFGSYLKADRALYRALRNRFNAAQTAYRALSETVESLGDRELQLQNREAWQALSEEAEDVLTHKSRDLEVFCWFIAAQIHLDHPLERVLSAVSTVTELVDKNWTGLHPIPPLDKLKADNAEAQAQEIDALRLRNFTQLVGEVPGSGLLHLPLTNLPLIGRTSYGDFLKAERDGRVDALRAAVADDIASEQAQLGTSVQQLAALQETLGQLDLALREISARSGEAPIQLSRLTKQVTDVLRMLRILTDGTAFKWPVSPTPQAEVKNTRLDAQDVAAPETAQNRHMQQVPFSPGQVGTREAALASLEALIAHFRITEPHSPVHTLLARALRWARLPLPEVMAEVLGQNSDALARLSMMAGLESAGDPLSQTPSMAIDLAQEAQTAPMQSTPQAPDPPAQADTPDDGQLQNKVQISSFEW